MLVRFVIYSILRNLRFFEPFLVLFLLSSRSAGGPELLYVEAGALIGFQKLLTGLLEIPSGVIADRWGRRTALMGCFACYCVAFPIFALSGTGLGGEVHTGSANTLAVLTLGMTFFAIGEALRTGSHKAIMLDWLEEQGRAAETTSVVGKMRAFSRASLGASCLTGGIVVFLFARFDVLFWMSAVPAFCGVLLIKSYPVSLEGEQVRSTATEEVSWKERVRALWAVPGLSFLMLQSVLFESQLKVAQHYVQPLFKETFESQSVLVLGGVGALAIGAYYFIENGMSSVASWFAPKWQALSGSAFRGNQRAVYIATFLLAVLSVCFLKGWATIALIVFASLTALQNMRRPIFVSLFGKVMDKPQKATTLSIESQARNWMVAVWIPATGYLADRFGLPSALLAVAITLGVGGFLNLFLTPPESK